MIDRFGELLSTPEMVHSLGWVFAVALIIGAVLNDGGRDLLRWGFAFVGYLIMQEVTRYNYFRAIGRDFENAASFTLIVGFVYSAGLLLGWILSCLARNRARSKYLKTHSHIKKEALNEHICW